MPDVNDIGVAEMKQFFADLCDDFTMAVKDGIIPLGKGAWYLPVIQVNVVDRLQECELFADETEKAICEIKHILNFVLQKLD